MSKRRPRRKKMRVAYLKKYSSGYISLGRQIAPISLEDYRNNKEDIHNYFLSVLFPGVGNVKSADAERERYLKKLQEDLLGQVDPARNISIYHGRMKQVRMFFNSEHNRFVFIEDSITGIRRSVYYGNRVRAMAVYHLGKVTWLEYLDTSPVSSLP